MQSCWGSTGCRARNLRFSAPSFFRKERRAGMRDLPPSDHFLQTIVLSRGSKSKRTYGLNTTLVATKVRPPLMLNKGPRTETTPETGIIVIFIRVPFSVKIVGVEVCA